MLVKEIHDTFGKKNHCMDNRSIRYSLSKPLPRSKEVLVPGLYLLDTVCMVAEPFGLASRKTGSLDNPGNRICMDTPGASDSAVLADYLHRSRTALLGHEQDRGIVLIGLEQLCWVVLSRHQLVEVFSPIEFAIGLVGTIEIRVLDPVRAQRRISRSCRGAVSARHHGGTATSSNRRRGHATDSDIVATDDC